MVFPDALGEYISDFENTETYFEGYFKNGQYLYNYGTYICERVTNGEKTFNMLFDWNGSWGTLNHVIAVHDQIYMDDSEYLCVKDNDTYAYIDWNGNVVSDVYYDATEFNEDGYAMVMEEKGTAYLIDLNFKKMDTIENVVEVGPCGDAFIIVYSDMEEALYIPAKNE